MNDHHLRMRTLEELSDITEQIKKLQAQQDQITTELIKLGVTEVTIGKALGITGPSVHSRIVRRKLKPEGWVSKW